MFLVASIFDRVMFHRQMDARITRDVNEYYVHF